MKPQFKREEIYLDLSKLSEDKRKEVRRLLFKKPHYEKLFFLPDYEDKPFLICLYGKWDLEVNKRMEYTELTYSQFLDMMGESKEKSKVIENSEKELINNDGTLYIGEGLENYYKEQLERTGKFKVVAIDATSEEVLQVENNGWISINEKPKTFQEVILYREDAGVFVGYYGNLAESLSEMALENHYNNEVSEETMWKEQFFYFGLEGNGILEGSEEPTHWVSLPSPPKY